MEPHEITPEVAVIMTEFVETLTWSDTTIISASGKRISAEVARYGLVNSKLKIPLEGRDPWPSGSGEAVLAVDEDGSQRLDLTFRYMVPVPPDMGLHGIVNTLHTEVLYHKDVLFYAIRFGAKSHIQPQRAFFINHMKVAFEMMEERKRNGGTV